MSDIYLSITETPTVVTLSAPVVSGALASTVTVANTVTVALDSNSLSALENVTVTVGAAITGTVTVSNFPATQPVSIASVTIGNTVTIAGTVTANPTGTQTIAGTVTANAGSGFPSVIYSGILEYIDTEGPIPVTINSGTVDITALPTGTNRIGVVTIGAGTVTIGAGTAQIGSVTASISGTVPVSISSVTVGNSVTIGSLPAISGTVTIGAGTAQIGSVTASISGTVPVSISSVTIGSALPVGTNRIGVVTIGGGTVTIGAGTAQIGSVTASVSNTNFSIKTVVALDGSTASIAPTPQSSFRIYTPVGASKTLNNIFGATPAWIAAYSDVISFLSDSGVQKNYLHSGTEWILDDFVTPAGTDALDGSLIVFNLSSESNISLSNGFTFVQLDQPLVSNSAMRVSLYNSSVTANTFAIQGTAVTTSNFTSTTASTLLAAANNNRKVLTIFNEGAGNLHICAGATCTTIAYQRKLASNEFFQVPDQQTAITHSAVFATAGTARIVQIT